LLLARKIDFFFFFGKSDQYVGDLDYSGSSDLLDDVCEVHLLGFHYCTS